MVFVITPMVVTAASGQPMEEEEPVYFDLETGELYWANSIPAGVSVDTLLRFPKVRQVDIMRAYVSHLNDRSIANHFRGLTDEAFWNRFWKEFDDDGYWLSNFSQFEDSFLLQTVTSWCRENGVPYYVAS